MSTPAKKAPPNVRVVHLNECTELVKKLNEAMDNVMCLAELADEHPYNEIALETLLSLRGMRDVIRLEMGSALGELKKAAT